NRKNVIHTPAKSYQYTQLSQNEEKGFNQSELRLDNNEDMEKSARKAWHRFLDEDISYYKQIADDVSQDFVTVLGKYLAYGLLDIHAIIDDLLGGYDSDERSYESVIRVVMLC